MPALISTAIRHLAPSLFVWAAAGAVKDVGDGADRMADAVIKIGGTATVAAGAYFLWKKFG